jgi:aspartyl-tRNA(Asn)/glutamyl-tRNA(Gln) amidotransferase subunit A
MSKFGSLHAIQASLINGQLTCLQLVQYYLERIYNTRHLNAYVEVWEEEALSKAIELDRQIQESPSSLGSLFGAVLSIKDTICYEGHFVTASSKILARFRASYSATAVDRLVREGAIIIGRTNCDQFGMGSSNENSIYGPVHHPVDTERVSGGSSGGAAVSVATDTCLAAVGSDTGGSIRQPAGFCGVWGLKPSYGRISRHGLLAYASSFDQIGFIASNPEDLRRLLSVCSGPDGFDPTVTSSAVLEEGSRGSVGGLRLAYFPSAISSDGTEDVVSSVMEAWIKQLVQEGHCLEAVDFDLLPYAVPAYYVLTTAEASSNLSRYDGIRYGHRVPSSSNLIELYQKTRSIGFSEEVKKRIMLGTYVLSSGYYEAYYTKAQQVRRLISDRIEAILDNYDAIVLPISPVVAWKIGERLVDPTEMYLSDVYTVLANLCGVPAVAFPIGVHPVNKMPIGVQIMGKALRESDLLEIATQINL